MDRFVIKLFGKKDAACEEKEGDTELLNTETEALDNSTQSTATFDSDNCFNTEGNQQNNLDPEISNKRKRERYFRPLWQDQYEWLEEKNNKSFCKLCNVQLPNNKPHLIRHLNSARHKKWVNALKGQPKIEDRKDEFHAKIKKIKIAELRIIMFLLQHNLPFLLINPLILLIKNVATDSQIAKDIKVGRTKAIETTKNIFLEEANANIANILQKQKFSVIIDETTDVSTSKCLCVVIRYFDLVRSKVRDRFLALIKLSQADAKTIYNNIFNFFKEHKIPIKNCIGFASDNASVMVGKKGGVRAYFLKENQHIVSINCVCHSLHLCSSAAAKMMPANVEVLARNIYLFFSHSPKRQEEYKQFQEYFNVETHKILKSSATRWLSLEYVVCRILEQWQALEHFFLCTSFESDSNSDLAHKINLELNAINKFYFSFLAYILSLTNKLNLNFQSESPRFHILLPTVKTYYKTILSNFIKPECISDSSLNTIDFNDTTCFKEIGSVYTGGKAEMLINSEHFSEKDISELKTSCRNYYIVLCKQIVNRIDFNDKLLNAVQGLNPNSLTESITPLISCMPDLATEYDIEELDSEWRILLNQEIVPKTLDFESYWSSVFKLKNALNQKMFPKLSGFISSILCLPHSSAAAERVFSQLSLIKDTKRNKLSTSTINAIMAAKELLNQNDSVDWMPPEDIIKKYNK